MVAPFNFYTVDPSKDNLAAELHGILHGILRTQEVGISVACIYSDSQEAIRVVNERWVWSTNSENVGIEIESIFGIF